jgi:hypothetical protein
VKHLLVKNGLKGSWLGERQNTINARLLGRLGSPGGVLGADSVQRIATSERGCGRRSALRNEGQNIVGNCTERETQCKKILVQSAVVSAVLPISFFRHFFVRDKEVAKKARALSAHGRCGGQTADPRAQRTPPLWWFELAAQSLHAHNMPFALVRLLDTGWSVAPEPVPSRFRRSSP